MTYKTGLQLPVNMFAIQGRCEDFAAAEQIIGLIPRNPRTTKVFNGVETRFIRVASLEHGHWPTTDTLAHFHLTLIPPFGICTFDITEEGQES